MFDCWYLQENSRPKIVTFWKVKVGLKLNKCAQKFFAEIKKGGCAFFMIESNTKICQITIMVTLPLIAFIKK